MEFTAAESDGVLIISDVEKQYMYVVRDFDMGGMADMCEAIANVLKLTSDRVEYVDYRMTRNHTALYRFMVWPF